MMKRLYPNCCTRTIRHLACLIVIFVLFGMTGYSQSGISITIAASRCGEGSVVLHATAPSGSIIKWYTVPFYGTAIGAGVPADEGTISDEGATFTTPSLIVTTAYYVDAVDAANCSLNPGSVRVPVLATISDNSIQASIFYVSSTFCKSVIAPQTPTRTGTAGGTYTATNGLIINSSSGAFTPSANANNTYRVTYTVTANEGCVENPAWTDISITNAPDESSISYTGSPFCTSLNSVTCNLTNPNDGTFSASPSGLRINASSGLIDPSNSLPGTYTVTYFVSSAGGCAPQAPTTSITITGLPDATITYSGTPYCKSVNEVQTPVLIGTGAYTGGAFSYTGTTDGLNLFDTSTGAFKPSTSTAGTYTISYLIPVSGNCATVTKTASVTIYNLPTAGIAGDVSVCQGAADQNITFTGNNGTAPYTFTYKVNNGIDRFVTSALGINPVSVTVPNVTSSPGTFVYTLTNITDAKGCTQTDEGTATIIITNLKVATFSYTNTPYCSNSVDPAPAYTGGGEAGSFTSTTGLEFATGEGVLPGTVDLSASEPGTYTVTNTISSGGCTVAPATASITITKLPVGTFHYASAAYCSSGTDPEPVITEGATLDNFTVDPSELSINAATGVVDLSLSLEGVYTITRTIAASAGCLPVVETTTVEIVAAPTQPTIDYTYNNTPTNDIYCNSGISGYVHRTGSSGGTYTISPTTGLPISSSSGTLNLLNATTGDYTVTYTIAGIGGCGALTATAPVTIIQGPTVDAGAFQDACSSSTVTLAGTMGGSATTTSWTTNGTGTFDNAALLNAVYTLGAADITATKVRLTLTAAAVGQCVAVTDTMMVNIFPAATVSANVDQTVCASSPAVTLAGTIGGGATSATWSGGAGSYNPNNTTLTAVYTPSAGEITAGTVTLTLTTDDPTGPCGALNDQMTITINPLPLASAGGSTTICSNSTATVSGASSANGTIAWTEDGTGTITAGATTLTPTYTAASGDEGNTVTLTMTVTTSFASCTTATATATYTIIINSVPTATLAGTTTVCQTSASPDITFTGANGSAPYTFTYKINTGSDLTVTTTSGSSVTVAAPTTTAGTFTYSLVSVHDANTPNCTQTQTGSAVITVDALTIAAAGANQALCATSTFTMAAVPTVGTGAWTFVGDHGTAAITTASSATTTITTVPTNTDITLRWTETNGTCSSTDDVVIRNDAQPTAAAGANQELCATSTFTMAAVPTVGTGAWTFVGEYGTAAITTASSTTTTITTVPTDANITLRWTETNGTCSSTDDVVIRNDAQPTAAAGANQALCATSTFTMAAVPTVGTGAWTFVGEYGTAAITTASSATTTITTVPTDLNITLRWTETNGTCSSTDDVVIRNDAQSVAAAGADQALCATATFTMAAVPTVGTGAWTFVGEHGTAAITTASSATTTITTVPTNTDITLRWTETNGTCSSTNDVVIRNNALPTITLGDNPDVTIGTTSANLTYSATTESPNKYSIVFDAAAITAGFASVTEAALGTTPIVITVPAVLTGSAPVLQAGVFHATLTVKNTTTGCVSSSYNITVTVRPAAPGVTGQEAQTFCSN